MAKRNNGSTAVLEPPPEDVDDIAAKLDTESPIQGPILEPEEVAVYEHEHYQEIRQRNEAVRLLDEQHERATQAKKRAKDALDDAQAELSEFISRGPSIPGRKYAKRVRLVKEVEAATGLGKAFLPLTVGSLFDVHDIKDPDVIVLIQDMPNILPRGSFEVVEWTEQPAKPSAPPKQPKRIRMLVTVGNDELGFTAPDAELDAVVDSDGDVSITLGGESYPLEPEEYEVIEWSAPIDPNGWRLVPISALVDFGVKPGLSEKLVDAGITTLGKLLDFQKDGTPLTSIKGIAGEKEAQIADAMVAYWGANPQFCQNAAEAAR